MTPIQDAYDIAVARARRLHNALDMAQVGAPYFSWVSDDDRAELAAMARDIAKVIESTLQAEAKAA